MTWPIFVVTLHRQKQRYDMDRAEKRKNTKMLIAEHVYFLTAQERMIQKIVNQKYQEMDERIEQLIDRKIAERFRPPSAMPES